jgi:HD-GYP domain-containing protein (c-di-GMP phosphodiesterase class II)
MRIISLDKVKGNELLAKDIINKNNTLLMTVGTMVKKEYAERLKDLGIEYIYVEDELAKGVNLTASLEIQIKEQCQGAVRDILQKYSYQNETELEEIKRVADEIISEIMSIPTVIYNLSSIRDKSESTYSHSLNVCVLSVILAFKLNIIKVKIREIAIGCLLHDIGFTYITLQYQDINIDSCPDDEQKEIKMHTIYGYSLVEKMNWLSPIAKDIIISHHERLDGSGYPFHIRGEKIKIGSRIAAVCDEFDSMVYGNLTTKHKVHDAIDYMISQAGVLFDFSVVKVFISCVAAYPTGTLVSTNQGEIGIVLRQNSQCPTRPIIRIITDKNGNDTKIWTEKDLTKELTLFITDTIVD